MTRSFLVVGLKQIPGSAHRFIAVTLESTHGWDFDIPWPTTEPIPHLGDFIRIAAAVAD